MARPLSVSLLLVGLLRAASAADLAAQAAAATPDAAHGHILYLKHCAACHGAHAYGDGPREIPALAGQQQRYLLEQLARFASGERQGAQSHGAAMHESVQPPDVNRPQALADLTDWLAHAARDPEPEHAESPASGGRKLYTQDCAACHGADGAGSGATPAIGGQHYSYLLGQLDAMATGRRPHAPLGRHGTPARAQLQALADYASRLGYLSAAGAAHTP